MIIAFAAGAAIFGIATAIGHSLISERKILGPLYAGNPGGVLKSRRTRAVIRAVFHMPSIAWAVLGIAVLAARIQEAIRCSASSQRSSLPPPASATLRRFAARILVASCCLARQD